MKAREQATTGGDFTTITNRGRNRVFHRFLAENRPRHFGETSTPDTPACLVSPSGPNQGHRAQPGPRGLRNHHLLTHRAPGNKMRPSERYDATRQSHNIARTRPAHHHRAQPPGTEVIPRLPPRAGALSTVRWRQHNLLPTLSLMNSLDPQTRNQQPPQAPREIKPHATQYRPRGGITP